MGARVLLLVSAFAWAGCGGAETGGCESTLCGCWGDEQPHQLVLRVASHTDGAPIEGIEVRCDETPGKVEARTGADGVARFSVVASLSPGCGFSRCETVTFTDPSGRFASAQASVRAAPPTPLRRFPAPGDESVIGVRAGPAQESVEWEQWSGMAPVFLRDAEQPEACGSVTDCAQVRCACASSPRTFSAATCASGACLYDQTVCTLASSLEPALCP